MVKETYLKKTFSLTGKTAIITGGGGVLPGAIAKACAMAGANVILWGRNRSTLEKKIEQITKEEISASRFSIVEIDLLKENDVPTAINESIEKFGKIDIFINGVGGSNLRCPFLELDTDEYEKTLKLNLLAGCVVPSKHIAKKWIQEKKTGTIINIASMGSFTPLSGGWAYSAAKAAVVNQTMAMAKEFAPYDIRVNAIAPGFFLGKQNKALLMNKDDTPTKRGEEILTRTPMKRFGQAEEVAPAVVFLASKAASFITGITLPIDGGYLCDNI